MLRRVTKAVHVRYTPIFDEALKEAATSSPSERKAKMVALLERDDARKAHPTFEHILPLCMYFCFYIFLLVCEINQFSCEG